MEKLSDTHKQLLRFLVKSVRSGLIPEEFHPIWTISGSHLRVANQQMLQVPGMTRLGLDLLADAELIFQRVTSSSSSSKFGSSIRQTELESHRICYITPAGYRAVDSDFNPTPDVIVNRPPVEITESLARFRIDFPDPTKLAFVMMQFGATQAHKRVLAGIRNALEPHGMIALRADDKEYHDELFFNILTYIYGTRFGIAVFERIEDDDFNPNVSLEVGYMLGLRKSVCLIKDKTLRTLHTDLVGKLYRSFDPQMPEETIPIELFRWMEQRGFLAKA